jgi:hypothetical protein
MAKKSTKEKKRQRTERRFVPQSTTSPMLVRVTGALGALALGAGLMGQYGRPEPVPYAVWILAAGALVTGVAVWIGTSGEVAIRVGDAGIGVEKGALRRMPWWGVEAIVWEPEGEILVVNGKDEGGGEIALRIAAKSQPQAVPWILKEARARIPKLVEVSDEVRKSLPKPLQDAGLSMKLEPMQFVGRHCAESGKVIAYEPDARVCPRCERVYHKTSVPETCACGGSLEALRKKPAEAASA